ncbi:VCBS domain-containing protein, partial [Novipirellula rosea]|uniref:VCBS domain-containing protein n=1 Tax=Novipirellula rosea TaxID=1031540 RepID=UPI0031E9F546
TTTGPAIPSGLATALASSVSITQTGTNDGSIAWDFSVDNSLVQYLADGETITATYTITVTDDSGTGNNGMTQDVTVTITGTNDQPTVTVVDVTGAVTEDATTPNLTDSGSVTFAEVDDTDLLNSSVALSDTTTTGPTIPSGLATALASSVSLTQTGTNDGSIAWDFSVDNSLVQYLADGETITATYTITVTDDSGTGNNGMTQDVTVTITGTNDASVAGVDTATATEAGGISNSTSGVDPTGNVLANDTDVDTSDSKSVSGVVAGNAANAAGSVGANVAGLYGSVTIQSDGNYVYNVDNGNSSVEALRTSADTLEDVFTYTMVDSKGASSTQQITITIQGVNDAPNDLTSTGMTSDENLANGQVVGTVSPSDVDSGDTALYRLTDDASGRFDIDSSGNIVVLDSSRLDYEIDTQHDITVEVTDTAGGTYLETFTITINDVDEYDVVALGDSDASANQVDENASGGVYVGITVWAVDADASNSTITHILVDDAGGRFEIDANSGQIVTASTAPLNYEVDTSHDVTVRSVSSDGSEVFQTYTIDILDINESSVAVDDSYSTISGQSISLTTSDPIANDTDPDGDALRLVLVTGPSNGTLSIDVNGVITYTPTAGFFGVDSFTYRSDDGSMLSDNIATVSINVQAGGGSGAGSGSGGSGGGGTGDTSGSGETSGGDSGDGDSSDGEDGSTTGAVPLVPTNVNTPNQNDNSSNEKGQSKHVTASVSRDSTIHMTDGDQGEPDHGVDSRGFSWGGSSNMHMKRGSSQMSQMLAQLLIVDLVQAIQWTEWNNLDGGPSNDSLFFGVGEVGGLGVGTGLASVGYVMWTLRGGVLLTTIFGSMPAWRMIDPSALLTVYRDAEGVRKSKADVTTFLD